MRKHYWQFLLNTEGQPIKDVKVDLYLAGTDTLAYISIGEHGAFTTTEATQVLTNVSGYFEFYIGDLSESLTYGYQYNQKFKFVFYKEDYLDYSIDQRLIFDVGMLGLGGYSGYSGLNGISTLPGYSGYSGISGYSGTDEDILFVVQKIYTS